MKKTKRLLSFILSLVLLLTSIQGYALEETLEEVGETYWESAGTESGETELKEIESVETELKEIESAETESEETELKEIEPAGTESEEIESEDIPETESISEEADKRIETIYINPLYENTIDYSYVSDLMSQLSEIETFSNSSRKSYYTTYDEVVSALRQAMTDREEYVAIYWKTQQEIDVALLDQTVVDALEHTGNPKEGDYIMFQYGYAIISAEWDWDIYGYKIEYYQTYYTTQAQEQTVDEKIQQVLSNLNLAGKTKYEKIKAVYDYICQTVAYDYNHLSDPEYCLQYTAYAALIQRTSVCQGYAVLLYRMLLECGVDCRVIAGTSDGIGHAWNIAGIDGKYYNLDSTWDAGQNYYSFFMKSNKNFLDHTRDAAYTSSSFNNQYVMSSKDYEISNDTPVNKKSILDCNIDILDTSVVYNGKVQYAGVKVTDGSKVLKEDVDYYLSSNNNADIGIVNAKLIGIGSYTGIYEFTYKIVPPAPTTLTLKLTGYNDVLASWNEVAGADGYYVYYKKSSADKYGCKIIDTTSITFKNWAELTQYNVKIVPYASVDGVTIKSSVYKMKKITTSYNLNAPTTLTLKFTGCNDVKASWSAVNGADGYYVYFKETTADRYGCRIIEETSTSFKNWKEETKYSVKIVPYILGDGVNLKSDNYKLKYVTTLKDIQAPTKLTLKSTAYNKVKASWTEVEGADGYYVYYKKSTASSYESKIVTESTITLGGLSASTKYNVKIVPYVLSGTTKIKSDYYKMTTVTTLAK